MFTCCRLKFHKLSKPQFVICKMGKTIVIDLKDCCGLHQVTGMKCLVSVIHVGFNNY